jgi:hypothetical protein
MCVCARADARCICVCVVLPARLPPSRALAAAQEDAEKAAKAAASRPQVVHAVPLFLRGGDDDDDGGAGGGEAHRPEDSVYYHPQLNPYGAPPPGRQQKWKTMGTAAARVAQVRRREARSAHMALRCVCVCLC